MGVPLTAAFAFGRLARINVFHHSPSNPAAPERPCWRRIRTEPRAGRGSTR